METIKKIIAAIDFSDHSRAVLSRAYQLAKGWKAGLTAIHVLQDLPYEGATNNAALVDIMGRLEDDAAQELNRMAGEMATDQVTVETEVLMGVPYRDLLIWTERHHGDFLVVGNQSRSAIKGLLLGRTAEALVRKSLVPVWVERKDVAGDILEILLPTDLSENSREGVLLGLEWARKTGAKVHLLHVVEVPVVPPFSLIDTKEYSEKMQELGEGQFDRFIEDLPLEGISCESHFILGDPLEEMEALVRKHKIGLVVLSSLGSTGTSAKLVGSVCTQVLRRIPSHALVIKPKRLDFSWLQETLYQVKA